MRTMDAAARWTWIVGTAVAVTGCSMGMSYEAADPEAEREGSVTVGAQAEAGGRTAPGLDRSVVPEVGDPPAMELPQVQDYTLDNGLRVVLVERTALPLVSFQLHFRGGASAHAPEKAGLASLTADMLDEGAGPRTALEIADALDLLGASFSTAAGWDASFMNLTVLRRGLDDALGILADMVVRPTFDADELERVKDERRGRILQRSDRPSALADDAFVRVLYGRDHPYGVPLMGTLQTLEALDRDDVVGFHRARYAPGQGTLVVVGDVTREELDGLLADAFQGWSGQGVDAVPPPPPSREPRRAIYLVDKPGAAQSEIRVGRLAVSRDTDGYFPLSVANTILGGSFTSRLNTRLREEKGYSYGARSYFDMRRAPGPFEASSAVATPVTDSSVVEFVRELERMGSEEVPAAELDRARNYLALRLPQRFESVQDVAGRLAELVLHDVPLDFYEGYVDGVLDVDASDVRDVSIRYLDPDGMVIVIAGDRSLIEAPLKALGLAPVVALSDDPISP